MNTNTSRASTLATGCEWTNSLSYSVRKVAAFECIVSSSDSIANFFDIDTVSFDSKQFPVVLEGVLKELWNA